jgi:hypothetical protein
MLMSLILVCGLQAPPPPQAPPIPPGYVAVVSKPCATCGKVNCVCGCKDGNNCVCAVAMAYYNVGGTVVKASSWAEAYKKAGNAPSAPQAAFTVPQATTAYPTASYAQTAPQMPFQGSYGGYSAPSYQGGSYGAACAGGG